MSDLAFAPGFRDAAIESQAVFRACMSALSRPTRLQPLAAMGSFLDGLDAAPIPLVPGWVVPVLAALVLAVGFRAGRRPGSRAPFRAVLVVAVIAVALLVAAGPSILT